MTDLQGQWKPRGLRPRRESFWGSSSGTVLAALILVALSWLGLHFYMEHQKRVKAEAQLAAEQAKNEAEEQARIAAVREAQQRELMEDNRQMLDAQAYSATHNYGRDSAGNGQSASQHRSVQQGTIE